VKIGILTGGGDAPGLNGIIEACSKTLLKAGHQVLGIHDGFEGVFSGDTRLLTWDQVEGAHGMAGTLLGTSNKSGTSGRESEFVKKYKEMELDGLIACGGDGTFTALKTFHNEINLLGVPKTIDNDLSGTDITFGYDTACSVVAEAVDSLRATANAHKRIIVVETMGRTAGWIALGGGLASYADAILIPERPFDKQDLVSFVKRRKSHQRGFLCVIAEGAHPKGEDPQIAFQVPGSPQPERFGGISHRLSRWLEKETGWEAREVVLGHLQRSRPPTTTDSFLTAAMGVEIARLAIAKKWGFGAAYRDGQVINVPITDFMGPARLVEPNHRWVKLVQALGGYI
jgi:6-phosphofructokinase 1